MAIGLGPDLTVFQAEGIVVLTAPEPGGGETGPQIPRPGRRESQTLPGQSGFPCHQRWGPPSRLEAQGGALNDATHGVPPAALASKMV